MLENSYKVTTQGQIKDGFNPPDVKQRVTALFKAPPDKIARLFSGNQVTIKENLDRETALKYQATLQKAGLICHIARQDGAQREKKHMAARQVAHTYQTDDQTEVELNRPATPEEIYLAGLEPAGLKPRLLAGLYTFFFVFCVYILLRLPIAAYLHFKYSDAFNNIDKLKGTTGALIDQMRHTNAMSSEFATYQTIAFVLAMLFFAIIVPMKSGRTWGQKKMGLTVLNRSNRIVRGFIPSILRLISVIIAVLTLGVAYLIPIFHPKNNSLSDLISGTRQVQAGPLPKRPIFMVLFPFALAILLFLAIAYPMDMLLAPQLPTAEEIEAQKAKSRTKETAAIPEFKITPLPLKPIRDCGPIIILYWKEHSGKKEILRSSYFEGFSGLSDSGTKNSMVFQLFAEKDMQVVYSNNGAEVCLIEPVKADFADFFEAEEPR